MDQVQPFTTSAICPKCGAVLELKPHPRHEGRMVGTCECQRGPVLEIDAPAGRSSASLLLEDVPGIGREIALACFKFGIRTLTDVALLSDEDLLMIPGIGKRTLEKLREVSDA